MRLYDTAVIGGGPAGSAAALALRGLGLEVVLIVAPIPAEKTQVGETLPPDARTLLEELGLWEVFVRDGHEATPGSCSCWGSERLEYNDFVRNPKGNGWHLDRKKFDALLLREVKFRGVELLPARATGFALEAKGAWLELTEAGGARQKIFARYTVDATGSGAAIARMTGASTRILDRLTFIYGFFEEADRVSRSQLTMLEAEEQGWWYLAPLPDSRVAVAFATDPEMVRKGGWTSESAWLASLLRTKRLAGRLEGCRYLRGERTIRSATSSLLNPLAGPRWLAVGDAAYVCDPLCSIGIYKALDTGIKAARIIAAELAGAPPAGATYANEICANFEAYRATRNYLYGLETRWTESAFWRNRRERANWGEGTAF